MVWNVAHRLPGLSSCCQAAAARAFFASFCEISVPMYGYMKRVNCFGRAATSKQTNKQTNKQRSQKPPFHSLLRWSGYETTDKPKVPYTMMLLFCSFHAPDPTCSWHLWPFSSIHCMLFLRQSFPAVYI